MLHKIIISITYSVHQIAVDLNEFITYSRTCLLHPAKCNSILIDDFTGNKQVLPELVVWGH